MRILVNFELRSVLTVHCLAGKTPISPFIQVGTQETFIRLLRYVGAGDAEIEVVESDIRRCSRGSIHLTLVPGRRNLLQIRPPWNADLMKS